MNEEDVLEAYQDRKEVIEERLEEFEELSNASEERKLQELAFVIFSSQTEARKAWSASKEIYRDGLLLKGDGGKIEKLLESHEVSYSEEKAGYIREVREKLMQPTLENPSRELKLSSVLEGKDLEDSRKWMVESLPGVGMKSASHFLRNTGTDRVAILSGHVVSLLYELGETGETEPPAGRQEYLEMERCFLNLSDRLELEPSALDLVLWSMRTGEVFR